MADAGGSPTNADGTPRRNLPRPASMSRASFKKSAPPAGAIPAASPARTPGQRLPPKSRMTPGKQQAASPGNASSAAASTPQAGATPQSAATPQAQSPQPAPKQHLAAPGGTGPGSRPPPSPSERPPPQRSNAGTPVGRASPAPGSRPPPSPAERPPPKSNTAPPVGPAPSSAGTPGSRPPTADGRPGPSGPPASRHTKSPAPTTPPPTVRPSPSAAPAQPIAQPRPASPDFVDAEEPSPEHHDTRDVEPVAHTPPPPPAQTAQPASRGSPAPSGTPPPAADEDDADSAVNANAARTLDSLGSTPAPAPVEHQQQQQHRNSPPPHNTGTPQQQHAAPAEQPAAAAEPTPPPPAPVRQEPQPQPAEEPAVAMTPPEVIRTEPTPTASPDSETHVTPEPKSQPPAGHQQQRPATQAPATETAPKPTPIPPADAPVHKKAPPTPIPAAAGPTKSAGGPPPPASTRPTPPPVGRADGAESPPSAPPQRASVADPPQAQPSASPKRPPPPPPRASNPPPQQPPAPEEDATTRSESPSVHVEEEPAARPPHAQQQHQTLSPPPREDQEPHSPPAQPVSQPQRSEHPAGSAARPVVSPTVTSPPPATASSRRPQFSAPADDAAEHGTVVPPRARRSESPPRPTLPRTSAAGPGGPAAPSHTQQQRVLSRGYYDGADSSSPIRVEMSVSQPRADSSAVASPSSARLTRFDDHSPGAPRHTSSAAPAPHPDGPSAYESLTRLRGGGDGGGYAPHHSAGRDLGVATNPSSVTTSARMGTVHLRVDVTELVPTAVSDLDVVCVVLRPAPGMATPGRAGDTSAVSPHRSGGGADSVDCLAVEPILRMGNEVAHPQGPVVRAAWQVDGRRPGGLNPDQLELAIEVRYGHYPHGTSALIAEGSMSSHTFLGRGRDEGTALVNVMPCDRGIGTLGEAPGSAAKPPLVTVTWEWSMAGAGGAFSPPRSLDPRRHSQSQDRGASAAPVTASFPRRTSSEAPKPRGADSAVTHDDVSGLARKLAAAEAEISRLRAASDLQRQREHADSAHATSVDMQQARAGSTAAAPPQQRYDYEDQYEDYAATSDRPRSLYSEPAPAYRAPHVQRGISPQSSASAASSWHADPYGIGASPHRY